MVQWSAMELVRNTWKGNLFTPPYNLHVYIIYTMPVREGNDDWIWHFTPSLLSKQSYLARNCATLHRCGMWHVKCTSAAGVSAAAVEASPFAATWSWDATETNHTDMLTWSMKSFQNSSPSSKIYATKSSGTNMLTKQSCAVYYIIWLRMQNTHPKTSVKFTCPALWKKNGWLMELPPPGHVLLVLLQLHYLATQAPVPFRLMSHTRDEAGVQIHSHEVSPMYFPYKHESQWCIFHEKNSSTGLLWRDKTWLRLSGNSCRECSDLESKPMKAWIGAQSEQFHTASIITFSSCMVWSQDYPFKKKHGIYI